MVTNVATRTTTPALHAAQRFDPTIGFARGVSHCGDPLEWIAAHMTRNAPQAQVRWLVDNRRAKSPLALVEVARFANQVKTTPEYFRGLVIAWVDEAPMSPCLRKIVQELPIRFREFSSIDEASDWLDASI